MKFLAVLAICIAGIIAAPLTSDQSALVKSTWNQVRHNEADILAAVFATYPDIQARFPQFVGKSLESIKDTAAFATHAGRIVGFVSEVVALLGNEANLPAVKTLVNQLGQRHKSRGIPQEQFNEFRSAILSYISAHSDWSDAAAAVWNQGIDNIYAILFSALAGNPVH